MMNYKNYKIILLMGLLVFVSIFSLSCNRKESVQLEIRNPFAEVAERVYGGLNIAQVKGMKLYKQYCRICHGDGGKGDGFNAFNLNPKPTDLTEVCKAKEDEYIIKVVTEGTKAVGKTSLCPPYGRVIPREDVYTIISYMKTFPD